MAYFRFQKNLILSLLLSFFVGIFSGPSLATSSSSLSHSTAKKQLSTAKAKLKTKLKATAKSGIKKVRKLSRPSFRRGVVEQVWENSKQPNGKVFDPNTGVELKWDKSMSRHTQWHMGHKPGKEWRKLRSLYENGKISRATVRDRYNDPSHYQAEDPSANMSHKFEDDD